MYAPSGALAISERTYALVATRVKSGPAQASTTIASRPSQVTSRKRHICLKRQRASLAMAGNKNKSFCRASVDVEDAITNSFVLLLWSVHIRLWTLIHSLGYPIWSTNPP